MSKKKKKNSKAKKSSAGGDGFGEKRVFGETVKNKCPGSGIELSPPDPSLNIASIL